MAFLKVVSLEEAISIINSFRLEIGFEEVTLDKALGRIVAEDIYSPWIFLPLIDRPLMGMLLGRRILLWPVKLIQWNSK